MSIDSLGRESWMGYGGPQDTRGNPVPRIHLTRFTGTFVSWLGHRDNRRLFQFSARILGVLWRMFRVHCLTMGPI